MIRLSALALALAVVAGTAIGSAGGSPAGICPRCGKAAQADDWRFCPYDGSPLAAVEEGAAPAAPAPARDALDASKANPLATVDDLFRAIAAGDDAWIGRLYRWDVFFGETSPEKIEERKAEYVKRLVAKVRPTLEGRERIPVDIKLTRDKASFTIALRERATHHDVMRYDFELTRGDDGWKIISIRP